MSLYSEWLEKAYNKDGSANKKLWDVYLPQEQRIYQYIISEKVENISGTITELSTKFTMTVQYICGFVDGINEVLPEPYDMESLDADSHISLDINLEKLYRKMVVYKAEHLYKLPEWKMVFSEEKLETMFWEERKSAVFTRQSPKVGRNDQCPCGSGKKYKKCCGSN